MFTFNMCFYKKKKTKKKLWPHFPVLTTFTDENNINEN